MGFWLETPRKMPYHCHATAQGDAEHGPYFEEDFVYHSSGGDPRVLTLYHSVEHIQRIATAEGSPFDLAPAGTLLLQRERIETLEDELARLRAENAMLSEKFIDREERLARYADPEALAASLAEKMSETFARKPGRKKVA